MLRSMEAIALRLFVALLLVLPLMASFAGEAHANYPHIAVIEDVGENIIPYPKGNLTLQFAASAFYLNHEDEFDFLFVFMNVPSDATDNGYLPPAEPVQQGPAGTNAPAPSVTPADYGSAGRLLAVGNMYSIHNYTDQPNSAYNYSVTTFPLPVPNPSPFSQVQMVGRAMMSYWGAYLTYPGSDSGILIGKPGNWNYYLNNGGSVLGGNSFREMSDNEYMTDPSERGFSMLDRYLLGVIDPEEVEDLFVLKNASDDHSSTDYPDTEGGYISHAEPTEISIDDIISANGQVERTASLDNPMEYRCAFIYVVPNGTSAGGTELQKMENLRKRFQNWVPEQTNNSILMDCRLDEDIPDPDGDVDNQGCRAGDTRCNLRIVEVCDDSGSWIPTENCQNMGLYCVDGVCVEELPDGDAECTYGDKRCNDGKVEECQRGGYWLFTENCEQRDMVCVNAECIDPNEVDGDETPNVDGDDGGTVTDGDQTTNDGRCQNAADCPLDENGQPQRCTASGTCAPCPRGTILEGEVCVADEDGDGGSGADGGGGCKQLPASAFGLLILFAGLGLLLYRRKHLLRRRSE